MMRRWRVFFGKALRERVWACVGGVEGGDGEWRMALRRLPVSNAGIWGPLESGA
jgi:hypothetical protein